MNNNVVSAVCESYEENGYGTLRFNFRGVGRSEGGFENGDGEQEDVQAALDYLIDLGYHKIDVAGYSFGAWINALAIKRLENASRFIFVSPPVSMMDFSFLGFDQRIRLVISADNDDYADIRVIEQMLPSWNPSATFKIVRGSDHFYFGKENELKSMISEFIARYDSIEDCSK